MFKGQYLDTKTGCNIKLFNQPEGVGDVTSGATDVADKLAKHRASHHSAIAGLQVVRAAMIMSYKLKLT